MRYDITVPENSEHRIIKEENTMSNQRSNSLFSRLYRTRILIRKGEMPIANISLLYCLIAALCAPWLFVGSIIAAIALGYQLSCVRGAEGFCGDFGTVVQDAKDNVRSAVNSFTGGSQQP